MSSRVGMLIVNYHVWWLQRLLNVYCITWHYVCWEKRLLFQIRLLCIMSTVKKVYESLIIDRLCNIHLYIYGEDLAKLMKPRPNDDGRCWDARPSLQRNVCNVLRWRSTDEWNWFLRLHNIKDFCRNFFIIILSQKLKTKVGFTELV